MSDRIDPKTRLYNQAVITFTDDQLSQSYRGGMSKNRSKEQAKRRLTRIDAQRICKKLNANPVRRVPGSKHPEETYSDYYYVTQHNEIRRKRLRVRPLDEIDELKLSQALWLMAKRQAETEKT